MTLRYSILLQSVNANAKCQLPTMIEDDHDPDLSTKSTTHTRPVMTASTSSCSRSYPLLLLSVTIIFFAFNNSQQNATVVLAATMIRQVAGQRCLFAPCRQSAASSAAAANNDNSSSKPPIVLLGGMAQSIAAWEQLHVPALTQERSVLVYEARGQGPEATATTSNLLDKVSLSPQADYLRATLDELELTTKVDLVGFSLGGRIAMAMAVQYPDRINKLHLTGVAADRSTLGKLTVASWKDHLSSENNGNHLKSFAWSILLATYSPEFLHNLRKQGKLEGVLDFITKQNTREGLLALLEQTHSLTDDDDDDEWTTRAMAERLCNDNTNTNIRGQLCVGSLDWHMAPIEQVRELSDILQWQGSSPVVIPDCGHAVPMEQPRVWRKQMLDFLNE